MKSEHRSQKTEDRASALAKHDRFPKMIHPGTRTLFGRSIIHAVAVKPAKRAQDGSPRREPWESARGKP